jgi:hypothetical protein
MTDLYPAVHVFVGSFLALLVVWWLAVRPYSEARALAAARRASAANWRQTELQAAYDEAVSELPRAKYEWRIAGEALNLAAIEHIGSENGYFSEMNPLVDPFWADERKAFEHWRKTFHSVQETYFALHHKKLHEYRDWEGRYGCDEEHYRFFYRTDDEAKEFARMHAEHHKVSKDIARGKFQSKLDVLIAERAAR